MLFNGGAQTIDNGIIFNHHSGLCQITGFKSVERFAQGIIYQCTQVRDLLIKSL